MTSTRLLPDCNALVSRARNGAKVELATSLWSLKSSMPDSGRCLSSRLNHTGKMGFSCDESPNLTDNAKIAVFA